MSQHAEAGFELSSWNEETFEEFDEGRKLTRAKVTQTFSGDIEGGGTVEWLMAYAPDGTARFVGLQQVRGALGGRSGSFVVESNGDFDGELAKGTWTVVPGCSTGELTGLRGQGTFAAPHGPNATISFDYDLDA